MEFVHNWKRSFRCAARALVWLAISGGAVETVRADWSANPVAEQTEVFATLSFNDEEEMISVSVREAIEFDISTVPDVAIISATLSVPLIGFGPSPFVQISGYIGDGAVHADDLAVDNTIAMASGDGGQTLSIDVTSFVQQLITSNMGFAGFTLSYSGEGAAGSGPFPSLQQPTLSVSQTPLPSSLVMSCAAGLVGLLAFARRRKKATAHRGRIDSRGLAK